MKKSAVRRARRVASGRSLPPLPELLLSTRQSSYRISRLVAAGRLKKIAPRLYTTRVKDQPAAVIRRNLWEAIGLLFPGAVIGRRTALELQPAPDGSVYLSGRYPRVVALPGVAVRVARGPGPAEGDARYGAALWLPSQARAYLENLRPSRAAGRRSPAVLARAELEDRLERLLRVSGEKRLNEIRDAARRLAPALGLTTERARLEGIIGRLLGSRAGAMPGPAARARVAGLPYDSDRLPIFDLLVRELRAWPTVERPSRALRSPALENEAFFDAYFSNYIEGTEFEVDEALEVVFENRIPAGRPQDAHDILGTYRLVSDLGEMTQSAAAFAGDLDGFLDLLRRRHHTILAGRPETAPGEFKTQPNRAGATVFVAPELVAGTLSKGLERLGAVETPFARAAFVMFLVAEVHPFADGNGRLARVMMNAELIAGGQQRVMVPTVYRDDYLGALRALSRKNRPGPLPEVLDRAQLFTSRIDFSDLGRARRALEQAQAFKEPAEGKLRIPDAER